MKTYLFLRKHILCRDAERERSRSVYPFGFDRAEINYVPNEDISSFQKHLLCQDSDRGHSVPPPLGFDIAERDKLKFE